MTRDKLIEKLKAYAPFGEFAGEPCPGALIAEALIILLTEKAPVYVVGGLPTVAWSDFVKGEPKP